MKNDIKKSIKVFEELSKVGFWEWDLVNDTILASDKTYEIYGTSKEIDGAYPNLNVKYGEKDAIKKIEDAINNLSNNGDYFSENIHIIKRDTKEKRIVNIISYLQVNNYDLHEDIQILIPMYRGKTGIDNINILLQNEFNPNTSKALKHGDREFRIGDKVIQLSNQVEDNVMNGDQGIVIGITEEKQLIVDFLGNEVSYKMGDLINLKHAYAMSIHKSQGSEYKVVILPIFRSYSIMLKRKLLYTAITRAKEKLILLGDFEAYRRGVLGMDTPRHTILKEFLQEVLQNEEPRELTIEDFL